MAYTEVKCACGHISGATGWKGGTPLAQYRHFEHVKEEHPEWLHTDSSNVDNEGDNND